MTAVPPPTGDGDGYGDEVQGLSPSIVALLAVACGVVVANLYYAQPLLEELRRQFDIGEVAAGSLVTVSQLGYAAGLVLIVPLADRFEKRRLIEVLLVISVVATVVAGFAPAFPVLLLAMLTGAAAYAVVQVIVTLVADVTPDASRAATVGKVVSGLLTGILLSRALGSVLANYTNWRTVYIVSAVLMAVLLVELRRRLPESPPRSHLPYSQLIASVAKMMVVHEPLRRRALYQACMFGAFSAFWTTIAFVLTDDPFDFDQLQLGAFALAGAAGALVAPLAGKWADRGHVRVMTVCAFVIVAFSMAVAGVGQQHIAALVVGAILLDGAVQLSMLGGQSVIFRLDPVARARINSAFMATFFLGGAIGSQAASWAYHLGGFTAVAVFTASLPLIALAYWATESRAADA